MSDAYLIRHIRDLWRRSEYEICPSAFLTPAEQREIFDELPEARQNLVFWGGAVGAERRCAVFLPDWLVDSAGEEAPPFTSAFSAQREQYAAAISERGDFDGIITPVKITPGGFVRLTHRDYLGAIMNLGIERSLVGDISVGDGDTFVFALPTAAELIRGELTKIGREGVRVSAALPGEAVIRRKFETIDLIVSSVRLDCIVKAVTNLSREGAQRLIRSGQTELNYFPCDDVSAVVSEGDVISVRGTGKFRFASVSGETKKERIKIKMEKYV